MLYAVFIYCRMLAKKVSSKHFFSFTQGVPALPFFRLYFKLVGILNAMAVQICM